MPKESLKRSSSFSFQPPTSGHLRRFRIAQAVGALALFVIGGVHLEQYYVAFFRVIPTIGPLFLVNFIGGTLFGLILIVPLRRGAGRVWLLVDALTALAGIGLSVGAFAGLVVSEHTPLFGFMEHGYRLEIVIALAAEAAAIVSLSAFVACASRRSGGLRDGGGVTPTAVTRPSASGASGV
jgi:hypothetical protein